MALSPFRRLQQRLFHTWFLLSRGLTLGVRAVVLDHQGRVFLVRHTYVPGWYLPGGGVETGETMMQALLRELDEEGNITPLGEPRLHAVYFNNRVSRRDHVALFVIRESSQSTPRTPDREIAETGWFAPDALPDGATPATRARLREVLDGETAPPVW